MGHQHDGVALRIQVLQNPHHHHTRSRIKRPCGLVGQDDFAAIHQRAGDGHPLLLTTRQFAGQIGGFVAQAQIGEQLHRALVAQFFIHARIHRRQSHVVTRAQTRQQIVALENKAKLFAAQSRQIVGFHV